MPRWHRPGLLIFARLVCLAHKEIDRQIEKATAHSDFPDANPGTVFVTLTDSRGSVLCAVADSDSSADAWINGEMLWPGPAEYLESYWEYLSGGTYLEPVFFGEIEIPS